MKLMIRGIKTQFQEQMDMNITRKQFRYLFNRFGATHDV